VADSSELSNPTGGAHLDALLFEAFALPAPGHRLHRSTDPALRVDDPVPGHVVALGGECGERVADLAGDRAHAERRGDVPVGRDVAFRNRDDDVEHLVVEPWTDDALGAMSFRIVGHPCTTVSTRHAPQEVLQNREPHPRSVAFVMTVMPKTADNPTIEHMREYVEWVRRFARQLVGDRAEAEEVVQDTWLAALRKSPAICSMVNWSNGMPVLRALMTQSR